MAKSLETIDTSLDPSRPVTTPNDVRENQRPLQISLPCPNDTQPEADDSDNTTDRDDFLSWDPWGDDSERYPEGFWNQIVDLPGIAQTSSSDSNERLSEIDMASITSGSTTCTSGDEPIAISHESVKEETTVSDPEDATKKAVDEEKAAEKDVEKEGSTEAERECTICLESVAKDRFPDLPHTAHSEHSSDVCLTCWEQHLEAEILSKNFEGVSCPLCSQKLLEADVRKLAKRSTYLEYLNNGAKGCMQQDEEFQSCPDAECHWGAFFAEDDGNIFNCQMCSIRWCLVCAIPFHEGQTCEGYHDEKRRAAEERKKEAEDALRRQEAEENERQLTAQRRDQEEEASNQVSRTCPSCKSKILKCGGCDHMTCRCGHEFCWQCSAPYAGPGGIRTLGNSVHKPTCSYYPNRLPEYQQEREYFHGNA